MVTLVQKILSVYSTELSFHTQIQLFLHYIKINSGIVSFLSLILLFFGVTIYLSVIFSECI